MSSKYTVSAPPHLSRRAVVAGGLAGAAVLVVGSKPAPAASRASSLPLITKSIPSSGEKLPVVGIGTSTFGAKTPEEIADRRDVLKYLPELGGKVVDTAWSYGESEALIGRLVKEIGNRNKLFIATKTATPTDGQSAAAALDSTFARLQMPKVDLLQIHSFRATNELYPVLVDAKKAGKVRYIGVTTSHDPQYPDMIEALRTRTLDFIQIDYSLGDRGTETILEMAKDKGIAVVANVPLGGSGGSLLTRMKGRPLPDWATTELDATTWPQLFLKYVIAHPAVTVAIPGTTRLAHLEDNQLAARGRLPDAAFRKKIEDYWASV
ncbi:MAG: aldo/keto reductase [Gammaproteobacteria bacterium]